MMQDDFSGGYGYSQRWVLPNTYAWSENVVSYRSRTYWDEMSEQIVTVWDRAVIHPAVRLDETE